MIRGAAGMGAAYPGASTRRGPQQVLINLLVLLVWCKWKEVSLQLLWFLLFWMEKSHQTAWWRDIDSLVATRPAILESGEGERSGNRETESPLSFLLQIMKFDYYSFTLGFAWGKRKSKKVKIRVGTAQLQLSKSKRKSNSNSDFFVFMYFRVMHTQLI